MNRTIISAIAAGLVASLALGTAARAEGDYYAGASRNGSVAIDRIATGSISPSSATADGTVVALDSGDYYDGSQRPN